MKKHKENKIVHLDDVSHVLLKSSMYIGSVSQEKRKEYIIKNDMFIPEEIKYVPGLMKLFNELIDNATDEYVRTHGDFSTKIDIKLDSEKFEIKDNGRGIPVTEIDSHKGKYWGPTLAWTELKAGSNFEDEESTTAGTNGVGSSLCSIFSDKFIGISEDGKKKCTVKTSGNNRDIKTKIIDSQKKGVHVTFWPDMTRFETKKIDDIYVKLIEQRLYNLSVTYPGINFKLNGKRIKLNSKKFMNMFDPNGTIIENEKFSIGVFPSKDDEFSQFSLMNGLTLSSGGNHIDYLSLNIVRILKDKIFKKYKTIKPSDVKRKLFIVCIMKSFPGPKYKTQSKEYLSNSNKEITEYFKELDIETFANKVYRNKNILDSIISYFKIAEEFKKRQELKGLNKVKKKIRSEKYIPSTGKNNILLIGEGLSASNSIANIIGRDGYAYYSLKGKPLNAHSASQSKFTSNKELTELYQIIKHGDFNYIVTSADADLDGTHIISLLIGFIKKYMPELLDDLKFGMLKTPVATISDKNNVPIKWFYNISDLPKNTTVDYKKGLGSWLQSELTYIIEKDTLEKMIVIFEMDDESSLDRWLGDDSQPRKDAIINNDFDLIKL